MYSSKIMKLFSENNCPNITQVIYLQHSAKEITQLGKHEISLNSETASTYATK